MTWISCVSHSRQYMFVLPICLSENIDAKALKCIWYTAMGHEDRCLVRGLCVRFVCAFVVANPVLPVCRASTCGTWRTAVWCVSTAASPKASTPSIPALGASTRISWPLAARVSGHSSQIATNTCVFTVFLADVSACVKQPCFCNTIHSNSFHWYLSKVPSGHVCVS